MDNKYQSRKTTPFLAIMKEQLTEAQKEEKLKFKWATIGQLHCVRSLIDPLTDGNLLTITPAPTEDWSIQILGVRTLTRMGALIDTKLLAEYMLGSVISDIQDKLDEEK